MLRAVSPLISDIIEQTRLATRALTEFGAGLFNPTMRLGITGLSRAGKTVFITALVHGLVRGGRFPVFEPLANGRIAGARLAAQPEDAAPRFDYERHVRALIDERRWPDSTLQISELRLLIDYQSEKGAMRTLTLDIVDYPGEWLLDLPLLGKSYEQWSAESLQQARHGARSELAARWLAHLTSIDPLAPFNESVAAEAAREFTAYLQACRDERYAMSLLPPGRFLMPGDLAGSAALAFAPLELPEGAKPPRHSLWSVMRQRYDSYRQEIVRPFFREHFARLDRQIVLVDALAALNAGPEAVRDLQSALASLVECFRIGRSGVFSALFRPRTSKIMFAATKADHLHHSAHDRLELILAQMVAAAIAQAGLEGAQVDVIALSAVRATREAQVQGERGNLPSIIGLPAAGESAGGERFDGASEVAIFPGDLPADAAALFADNAPGFRGLSAAAAGETDYRFIRFRPPQLEQIADGLPALPHIRLDRAMQFLLGDRLR
jgi:predicted YcjX-like family ATPase